MVTQAQGFAWYGNLPVGVERILQRHNETRRSFSWFLHRLPPETDMIVDQSSDPVISFELDADGVIERSIDGAWQEERLTRDTVTLTPAATRCDWRWIGKPLDILDVYIPYELLQAASSEYFRRGDGQQVNLSPVLRLESPTILMLMRYLMTIIESRHTHASILYETLTNHMICSMLGVDEAITVDPTRRSTLNAAVLQRVKDYIEENLAEDISLDALAATAGVSRFHFLRLFRNSIGMTPHVYLTERRMVRASNLLLTTEMPIIDIASECGFADPSYFAARFRALYRTSPRSFRSRKS